MIKVRFIHCAGVKSANQQDFFSLFLESFKIPQEKVSYMIPTKFQDINIRIFTRDPSKIEAIRTAFRRYLDKIN